MNRHSSHERADVLQSGTWELLRRMYSDAKAAVGEARATHLTLDVLRRHGVPRLHEAEIVRALKEGKQAPVQLDVESDSASDEYVDERFLDYVRRRDSVGLRRYLRAAGWPDQAVEEIVRRAL